MVHSLFSNTGLSDLVVGLGDQFLWNTHYIRKKRNMDSWYETRVQSLLSVDCEDALFAELLQATRELGFEFCAYGIRARMPISSPKVRMINNYPQKWQQQYSRENYLAWNCPRYNQRSNRRQTRCDNAL